MSYKNREKQLKHLLLYQKALGVLKKNHEKEFKTILDKLLKREREKNE